MSTERPDTCADNFCWNGQHHSQAAYDEFDSWPCPMATPAPPVAPDEDALAIAIEDVVIDHGGSGGASAATDRILDLVRPYFGATGGGEL